MPTTAEPDSQPRRERGSGLALIPLLATAGYYALPPSLQVQPVVQFTPQVLAYLCLAVWASKNHNVCRRLGLNRRNIPEGLRWGLPVGVTFGVINVLAILWVVPWLGGDIQFLQQTPHARIPMWMMLPWIILSIAFGVELNFRGFLLGRLHALTRQTRLFTHPSLGNAAAIAGSALVFSFDPFMVATFQHLHWIAVWDGVVWGMIWIRLNNLHATIVAHAVEVMVMYTVLKIVFTI